MNINEEIVDNFYVLFSYFIDKYGKVNANDINEGLLNAYLVVTKVRPAYILDSIRFNNELLKDFLDTILEEYKLLSIKITSVEYLLYLQENEDYVIKNYKNNMADVLGYCYNGRDFASLYIAKVKVIFNAISNVSGYKTKLFITSIPKYAYETNAVQQCIENRVTLFNSVLTHLDYTVIVTIDYW